jgi:hypothetical protein
VVVAHAEAAVVAHAEAAADAEVVAVDAGDKHTL